MGYALTQGSQGGKELLLRVVQMLSKMIDAPEKPRYVLEDRSGYVTDDKTEDAYEDEDDHD